LKDSAPACATSLHSCKIVFINYNVMVFKLHECTLEMRHILILKNEIAP